MSEFNFQTVFQILHEPLAGNTSIKKEELYRDIFQGVYQIAGRRCEDDEDTAPFRKFTSGSLPIQKYVAKKLHTEKGFELTRKGIEEYYQVVQCPQLRLKHHGLLRLCWCVPIIRIDLAERRIRKCF